MTTLFALPRPYTVQVDAIAFTNNAIGYTVSRQAYIDTGLIDAEHDALTSRRDFAKLSARELLQLMTIVGALTIVIVGFSNAISREPLPVAWAGAGAIALAFGIGGWLHLQAEKKRRESLIAELIIRGVLSPVPADEAMAKDLKRIEETLTALHDRKDLSRDAAASTAVSKVVWQDYHRPTAKQQSIADSKASDEDSRKIRAAVEAQTATWNADVAAAEIAIWEFETSALGITGEPVPF